MKKLATLLLLSFITIALAPPSAHGQNDTKPQTKTETKDDDKAKERDPSKMTFADQMQAAMRALQMVTQQWTAQLQRSQMIAQEAQMRAEVAKALQPILTGPEYGLLGCGGPQSPLPDNYNNLYCSENIPNPPNPQGFSLYQRYSAAAMEYANNANIYANAAGFDGNTTVEDCLAEVDGDRKNYLQGCMCYRQRRNQITDTLFNKRSELSRLANLALERFRLHIQNATRGNRQLLLNEDQMLWGHDKEAPNSNPLLREAVSEALDRELFSPGNKCNVLVQEGTFVVNSGGEGGGGGGGERDMSKLGFGHVLREVKSSDLYVASRSAANRINTEEKHFQNLGPELISVVKKRQNIDDLVSRARTIAPIAEETANQAFAKAKAEYDDERTLRQRDFARVKRDLVEAIPSNNPRPRFVQVLNRIESYFNSSNPLDELENLNVNRVLDDLVNAREKDCLSQNLDYGRDANIAGAVGIEGFLTFLEGIAREQKSSQRVDRRLGDDMMIPIKRIRDRVYADQTIDEIHNVVITELGKDRDFLIRKLEGAEQIPAANEFANVFNMCKRQERPLAQESRRIVEKALRDLERAQDADVVEMVTKFIGYAKTCPWQGDANTFETCNTNKLKDNNFCIRTAKECASSVLSCVAKLDKVVKARVQVVDAMTQDFNSQERSVEETYQAQINQLIEANYADYMNLRGDFANVGNFLREALTNTEWVLAKSKMTEREFDESATKVAQENKDMERPNGDSEQARAQLYNLVGPYKRFKKAVENILAKTTERDNEVKKAITGAINKLVKRSNTIFGKLKDHAGKCRDKATKFAEKVEQIQQQQQQQQQKQQELLGKGCRAYAAFEHNPCPGGASVDKVLDDIQQAFPEVAMDARQAAELCNFDAKILDQDNTEVKYTEGDRKGWCEDYSGSDTKLVKACACIKDGTCNGDNALSASASESAVDAQLRGPKKSFTAEQLAARARDRQQNLRNLRAELGKDAKEILNSSPYGQRVKDFCSTQSGAAAGQTGRNVTGAVQNFMQNINQRDT